MADFTGNNLQSLTITLCNQDADGNPSSNFIFFNTISNQVTYYLMRAIDPDCPGLTYRTWVVTTPDATGSAYLGPKCGPNPLTNIVVAASWEG